MFSFFWSSHRRNTHHKILSKLRITASDIGDIFICIFRAQIFFRFANVVRTHKITTIDKINIKINLLTLCVRGGRRRDILFLFVLFWIEIGMISLRIHKTCVKYMWVARESHWNEQSGNYSVRRPEITQCCCWCRCYRRWAEHKQKYWCYHSEILFIVCVSFVRSAGAYSYRCFGVHPSMPARLPIDLPFVDNTAISYVDQCQISTM